MQQNGLQYSVLHSLFALNTALSAACESQDTFDLVMLHLLYTTPNLGWGKEAAIVSLGKSTTSPSSPDDIRYATLSPMAQIYARVAYYLTRSSSSTSSSSSTLITQCLKPSSSWSSSCPQSSSSTTPVDCVRGITISGSSLVSSIITNGCSASTSSTVSVTIPVSAAATTTTFTQLVFYEDQPGQHSQKQDQDFWVPLSNCSSAQLSQGRIFDCEGMMAPAKTIPLNISANRRQQGGSDDGYVLELKVEPQTINFIVSF